VIVAGVTTVLEDAAAVASAVVTAVPGSTAGPALVAAAGCDVEAGAATGALVDEVSSRSGSRVSGSTYPWSSSTWRIPS
jgi:hypothetical protein